MSLNASSNFSLDSCIKVYIAFNGSRVILLLPFSIIILYLGVQKWRQQRSLQTASHSDIFAYHLAAMELVWVIGCFFLLCSDVTALAFVGQHLTSVVNCGEMLFHILTCVERYLAVVHPIIYMGLKNTRGVRIRNITIGCIGVISFIWIIINVFLTDGSSIALFCLLGVSIIITCYCSVSVLCVLIRPGPGGGAKEKQRVEQSKRRAFFSIIAISASLGLWFGGLVFASAFSVSTSHLLNYYDSCLVVVTVYFSNLPSCLVSPLLYLQRAGKLTFSCCGRK